MDDRNAQVGWTEAQWNRVRQEVLRAWQSVRIAGSFLPTYGPLPPSTEVIPSEMLNDNGTVDDQATATLVEISLPVALTRQQVMEEDLSSALLQFRRRATQVGQLEDWHVFNGVYASRELATKVNRPANPEARYLPAYSFMKTAMGQDAASLPNPPRQFTRGATLELNPGALGLVPGALRSQEGDLTTRGLITTVVKAMDELEQSGYVAPYVCVFGLKPFEAAHIPVGTSLTFPRDRIEPLIGRELLHASAIDIPPWEFQVQPVEWQNRGVLLSLAGDAVDLAIAAETTPEFRQVDIQGRYVFSVLERFALRIKDPTAIVTLAFGK